MFVGLVSKIEDLALGKAREERLRIGRRAVGSASARSRLPTPAGARSSSCGAVSAENGERLKGGSARSQRAKHGVRFTINHGEQNSSSAFRLATSGFPVLDAIQGKAEATRERGLA